MFYSQFILAKKGPLGTIWIAAHLERKLRKNQVTETNIGVSVDSILFPEVPIALRLSGHLLLGVVRIYSRKVNYLFHDCSEALLKIKQAFNSGAVDLPPEAATAPFHSITLPDNFDLDDLELLPDREALFLANSSIDHHVTSREQITLQDTIDDSTYLGSQFGLDERFPDGGAPRLEFDEDVLPVKSPAAHEEETDDKIHGIGDSRRACALDTDSCLPMDALHEATAAPGQDGDEAESEEADQNKHAEGAGREDTSHPGETNAPNIAEDRETHKFGMEQVIPEIEKVLSAEDVPYLEPNIMELAVDADSTVLNAAAPALQVHEEPPLEEDALRSEDIEETPALKQDGANLTSPPDFSADEDLLASILGRSTPSLRLAPTPELPPAKRQKTASKAISRKRKVRLDEATVLHGNEMRHQLSDTSDIRRLRRRAPCTEYEIWSSQRAIQGQLMFDDPLIPGYCESIRRIYHCIFHAGDVKLPDTGRRSMQDKHQLDHEENHESLTLDEEAFDEFAFYDLQGTIDDEQSGPKDIQPNQPPAEAKDIQPNQPPAEAIRDTNGGDIPCVETQPVQPEVNEEGEKTELVDVLGQPPTTGNGGPSDAVVQAEQMLERDGDVKNDSVSFSTDHAEANGEGPEVLNPAAQEIEEADETPEGLGFLTDSKDEENDHDDRAQDNTGWSIRTRAVCQYLRTTFEAMESSRDGTKIGLERLLQGKTRRESARMFFESLVLKTKDYINVEQTAPFANIYITPRARLMKVDI